MSSEGAAPRAVVPVSSARAEASRKNGAKSRGPKTEAGKARSARNALKHGLRAQKYVVLPEEDATEFAALEAALRAELAPVGALQAVLAQRIAAAAWRLARADRIEAELLVYRCGDDGDLARALIRDGNGTRSFETLLRYRGAAMAELMRSLRTLKALQAEQAAAPARAVDPEPAPVLIFEPNRGRAGAATQHPPDQGADEIQPRKYPIEPESRGKPGDPGKSEPVPSAGEPGPPGPARARTNPSRRPAARVRTPKIARATPRNGL
jgi:hypothetical protein